MGDRMAVGVVHWDGAELRSHFDETRARSMCGAEPAVVAAIRTWKATTARLHASDQRALADIATLGQVLWLPEGVGSALVWSDERVAEPTDAAKHFDRVCRDLHLTEAAREGARQMTMEMLRSGLSALGERLARKYGSSRVRVDQPTTSEVPYTPPVSWRNGRWHHAVPVSFDTHPGDLSNRAHMAFGRIQKGIPAGDVAVVLAWMPRPGEVREEAERMARSLETTGKDTELTTFDADTPDPFLAWERRIEHDLARVDEHG